MKKILFVSNRNPFSGRYSGDVIRAKKIVNYLSKNNFVKVVSINRSNIKKKYSRLSYQGFRHENLLFKIFYIILSLINFKPMQLGYFFSSNIKDYIKDNCYKYDILFFQSFRTAQYLPNNINKKNILDMADLVSENYSQTSKELFFLNPVKVVYFFEYLLLKKYEDYCLKKFHKILLHSKKEIKNTKKLYHKKIIQYPFGVDQIKKKYKFSKKNYKIIFIGNIRYIPNKRACYNFANKILPLINKKYPDIEFHIIGEIAKFDKLVLKYKKNVKVLGQINKLEPYLEKVICGLANLDISSGIQTKLLTYMSFGIPSISSRQVAENFDAIKNSKIIYYKNDQELITKIIKLKNNKNFSVSASKRSLLNIKKLKWEKVLSFLDKI